MTRRELILWQPGRTGSISLISACTLLIVLVAYLHVFTAYHKAGSSSVCLTRKP